MGRRSTHTPQQLRELILNAAQEIIESQGLAGLSAREIARRIGYSPGTIYNMFQNLDDVVLNVEARVLDALDARLIGVLRSDGDAERTRRAAGAGLPRLHARKAAPVEPAVRAPHADRHRAAGLVPAEARRPDAARRGGAGAALFPAGREAERQRAARVLWAGVHGITSLSTADKLSVVTTETASRLIEDLVGTYLAGLSPAWPGAS